MSANPGPRLTADEYLAMDRSAEWKSEFHDGEMVPIEAISLRHSMIFDNLVGALRPRLKVIGCKGLPGPLRVRASVSKYVYPDYQILGGKAELTDKQADTVVNPKVAIEILSPLTADYDHGGKFELYRRLKSVEEYVLISQTEPKVEVFTKQSERTWSLTIIDGPEQPVRLQSVGIEFPLADLYDGVETV